MTTRRELEVPDRVLAKRVRHFVRSQGWHRATCDAPRPDKRRGNIRGSRLQLMVQIKNATATAKTFFSPRHTHNSNEFVAN
jgi:hypothetical protein